jgi:putative ABC transport system permease protein
MLPLITLKQFWNDLRRQKLRSMLTMFGIFWGTCSIVLLFAFGKGIGDAQLKSQKGMGDNIAIFWPGITGKEYKGLPKGREINPVEDDIVLIRQKALTIENISPEFRRWNQPVKLGRNVTMRTVIGVWPEFGLMRNLIPEWGSRFFNARDMEERRRVVFIGNILKTDLFGTDEAVGQRILISGVPFTVMGVMKEKVQNSSYGGRDSRIAFIPASTFRSMYSQRWMNNFVITARETYTMEQAKREVYEVLGERYRFDPTDREALSVWDTSEGFEFLRSFFGAFQGLYAIGLQFANALVEDTALFEIGNARTQQHPHIMRDPVFGTVDKRPVVDQVSLAFGVLFTGIQ